MWQGQGECSYVPRVWRIWIWVIQLQQGTIQLSVNKEILHSLQFPGLFPRHITASRGKEERLQSFSLNNLLYSQEKFYPKGKNTAPENAVKCSHLHRDVHSNSATSTHLCWRISWLTFSNIFSARGYLIWTKTFEMKLQQQSKTIKLFLFQISKKEMGYW